MATQYPGVIRQIMTHHAYILLFLAGRPGAVHAQTYSAYPGSIASEVDHFVRCVRQGAKPLSTLDDAIDAQRIVDACEQSAASGQSVEIDY